MNCYYVLRINAIRYSAWVLLVFAIVASVSNAEEMFDEARCVTLFAFDNESIPFTQNLRLEMQTPERHVDNPVIARGKPGEPDAMGVQFYGSVIREKDKFRMWYVAYDDDIANKVATERWRAAYAESDDGVHWIKPWLGLVEYKGNKNNNLILTDPMPLGFVNLKVLADSEDSNPKRRYKISTHVYFRHNTRLGSLAPFVSEDGLTWKMLIDAKPKKAELKKEELALPAIHFEPCGGLYKWNGIYYICGQNAMNATQPYHGRVARTYRSSDFVNWSHTSNIAFVRDEQHTLLGAGRSLEGEQNHEGISVWNRRNVLLGIYGRWHGAKEWKDITVDLGFLVSNDGLRFREPAHDRTFLKRGEDGMWDQGGVLQGQGFENVGDRTYIYYGAWDPRMRASPRGGVGIATLPRDRFGELVIEEAGKGAGDYQLPDIKSEFVTASVPAKANFVYRLYLNATGLESKSALKIELLDDLEQPIIAYAGANAAIIRKNGFQTPIHWAGKEEIGDLPEQFKVRVTFEGEDKTSIRFSAIYVRESKPKS